MSESVKRSRSHAVIELPLPQTVTVDHTEASKVQSRLPDANFTVEHDSRHAQSSNNSLKRVNSKAAINVIVINQLINKSDKKSNPLSFTDSTSFVQ